MDAHHGNGAQAIFRERDDVLTASVHVDPAEGWFPHFLGFADETTSTNLNVTLAPGSGDDAWLAGVDRLVEAAREHGSEALVVALGVDAAADDPNSPLAVTEAGFREAGRRLGALRLPTVVVQEGGYVLETVGALVRATLEGLDEVASDTMNLRTRLFLEVVCSHIPEPPARVLEVGCGKGDLALALAERGFDVTAIDPKAPDGPIFRQVRLEDFSDEHGFDAVVASLSLHHIHDLGHALDTIAVASPAGRPARSRRVGDRAPRRADGALVVRATPRARERRARGIGGARRFRGMAAPDGG